jgi:hypothetical protein
MSLLQEEFITRYPLYEDYLKGINYLGNAIEGNGDAINRKFYGAIDRAYRQLAGKSVDPYSNNGVSANASHGFSKQLWC